MIRGTRTAEITESLPTGEVIRIFATGDKPRSYSLEIIDTKNNEYVKIYSLENLKIIANILKRFELLDNTQVSKEK